MKKSFFFSFSKKIILFYPNINVLIFFSCIYLWSIWAGFSRAEPSPAGNLPSWAEPRWPFSRNELNKRWTFSQNEQIIRSFFWHKPKIGKKCYLLLTILDFVIFCLKNIIFDLCHSGAYNSKRRPYSGLFLVSMERKRSKYLSWIKLWVLRGVLSTLEGLILPGPDLAPLSS